MQILTDQRRKKAMPCLYVDQYAQLCVMRMTA